MLEDSNRILEKIGPEDLVLDVGGWACPFNRANWIIDSGPYETRGFYASIGLPRSQGGDREYFSRETWVSRDLCDREPWPFQDKQFDYSICSHTLEDLRDPLYVCSELVRVSKAGYIEIPSRLWETCLGVEHPRIAGLSHHRWLIDRAGEHLQFTQKYHSIHSDFDLSFPVSYAQRLTLDDSIVRFHWKGGFTFAETTIHGSEGIRSFLSDFVAARNPSSRWRFWWRSGGNLIGRAAALLQRAVK